MSKPTRRHILSFLLTSAGALLFPKSTRAATQTPRATEGPFYPTPSMRRDDIDNDLVKIMGRVQRAGGEVLNLRGRITDTQGKPLSGLRIEIWQCDMNGTYMHPGDDRGIAHDSGFQGFGHDITDADGAYRFRTIKPAKYPGRTPHIHVKVRNSDRELLTTQFYIKDDPDNERDGLYRRMSAAEAASVSMAFERGQDGLSAEVNVML